MSITIIENEKPELNPGTAICDGGLNDKLNKYELTKFLNNHQFTEIIGRPKSGKSSLVQSLFRSPKCLRKCYHNVYLFQPAGSRGSMKDDIFNYIPPEQIFNELTFENLSNVINIIDNEDKKFNNCIIFDDMASYLKQSSTLQLFKQLIFNRRHMRTSIWVLSQTYFSIPKELRKLATNIIVFRVSKNEMHEIFDENVENLKDMADKISKVVFDKKFEFLFINVDTQTLMKGWDTLLIKDKDEVY
jgi:hypothetical protein